MQYRTGQIVRFRDREWVVLPSREPDFIRLRPIGGSEIETCGVYLPLLEAVQYDLPSESIKPAHFPEPTPDHILDHQAVKLTIDAARLLLRDGAVPFRCLGRISVRPHPYQFVPLLMALRLSPVRILIADDVGVGKTIEALLIARELFDRGEIQRIGVLCPPYLVDQWQKEMKEKFNLDAVAIRSSSLARLERQTPPDQSVFSFYPFFVASIDLVKLEKYRPSFIQHAPDFIIIDEVHGCARPPQADRSKVRHQRYLFVQELARKPARHLVLLTATPHSGYEDSFLSILGFLNPAFESYDLNELSEDERTFLARHFIQRRRADVAEWLEVKTHFPKRLSHEIAYPFSPEYRNFFRDVFKFATDIVTSAEKLSRGRQKLRHWAALSLLRAITSSPATAEVALRSRLERGEPFEKHPSPVTDFDSDGMNVDAFGRPADAVPLTDEGLPDDIFRPEVSDDPETEIQTDGASSTAVSTLTERQEWTDYERRKLREFIRQARSIRENWQKVDRKAKVLLEKVRDLLNDGHNPIVWCRYVPTVKYLKNILDEQLSSYKSPLQILAITGEISDDERRARIEAIDPETPRILIATDCLSEGINLQNYFDAVIHYDLPWNPNRLEQREGRVDRFGQNRETVHTILLYGKDNPVDGAVLEILLKKARTIHKQLGIILPLPESSEGIMEAVFKSLFARVTKKALEKPLLDFMEILDAETRRRIQSIEKQWDRAAQREYKNRTRFAQRAIKPDEIARLMNETDSILGKPEDALAFLHAVLMKRNIDLTPIEPIYPSLPTLYRLDLNRLPDSIRYRLHRSADSLLFGIGSLIPPRAEFLGRNHPLIETLAEYVLTLAMHPTDDIPFARAGVIRTRAVNEWSNLFVLRVRYELKHRDAESSQLAEEIAFLGVASLDHPRLVADEQTQHWLEQARPTANLTPDEKKTAVQDALNIWHQVRDTMVASVLKARTRRLQDQYRSLRRSTKLPMPHITPIHPPDLLALLVLIPDVLPYPD